MIIVGLYGIISTKMIHVSPMLEDERSPYLIMNTYLNIPLPQLSLFLSLSLSERYE